MLRSKNFCVKSWKRNEIAALITLFESEEVLYNVNHPDYYNRKERNAAYSRILDIMQRIDPNCSLNQIETKLRFLLSRYSTEFSTEQRRRLAAGTYTVKYKPSYWYFCLLTFLNDFSPPYLWKEDFQNTSDEVDKEDKLSENDASEVSCAEDDSSIDSDNGSNLEKTSFRSRKRSRFMSSVSENKGSSFDSKHKSSKNGIEKKETSEKDLNHKKSLKTYSLADGYKPRELKKAKHDDITEIPLDPISNQKPFDREDIFGQYIASEIKTLRDNPLLYLQTKQAILEILTNANVELLGSE